MANYATEQHSYGRAGGPRRVGQDHARRGAAARSPARSRRRAASSAARRSAISIRSKSRTSIRCARRSLHLDTQRHAHPPDRHARLSRFHRPGDRRARRRRDRRGRRQRADRHRDDHVAHDGLGGEAQALPPRHRQQDRRRERRPAEACSQPIQAAFGKECLPINLPADGGKRVVDCFFNPVGRADFSSVAAAHGRSSTRSSKSTRS